MTRKDTILIAVVINAGLLAVLFTTAVIYDTEGNNERMEFVASPLVDNKISPAEPSSQLIAAVSTGDEVDNVLKYYAAPTSQPIVVQSQSEVYIPLDSSDSDDEALVESNRLSPAASQEPFIEVVVKRGDVLEKIAKAHKTSVAAIKQANNLENERLSIGQVLKIPVKQHASVSVASVVPPVPSESIKAEPRQEGKKDLKGTEPVYYVIKSGDNPWKIAKQYGVKYDEILRLNNLDEDKARNLKIGDRIRVK